LGRIQSSEQLNTELPSTSCFFSTRFVNLQAVISSIFNLRKQHTSRTRKTAGAPFFLDWDNGLLVPNFAGRKLFWFGLLVLVFFKHSTHEPSSKEQLLTFQHFLETSLAEKIAVCAHTTRLLKK
jgi:hypothetical protein